MRTSYSKQVGYYTLERQKMHSDILRMLNESVRVKEDMVTQCATEIEDIVAAVIGCLQDGHKVLIFGNGGSAADAQHIAAEFVNRFRLNRRPLPAIALTTDTSVITSIANDFGYELIFDKQVEALAQTGDIVWGISTSGNSANVIKALKTAKKMGLATVGFSGAKGQMAELCDYLVWGDSKDTPRIQEAHITIAHIICELVETRLFGN